MSIKYHLVEAGMTLWSKSRQRMGNTTMGRDAWHSVRIVEKHDTHCLVSWNGNPPRRVAPRHVEKYYRQRLDRKEAPDAKR